MNSQVGLKRRDRLLFIKVVHSSYNVQQEALKLAKRQRRKRSESGSLWVSKDSEKEGCRTEFEEVISRATTTTDVRLRKVCLRP